MWKVVLDINDYFKYEYLIYIFIEFIIYYKVGYLFFNVSEFFFNFLKIFLIDYI